MNIASIAFDFFPPLFFINRVVLLQIWKTEYTRVQLPGHEECSVSQGHVLSSAPEEAGNTNTLHLKCRIEQEHEYVLLFSPPVIGPL